MLKIYLIDSITLSVVEYEKRSRKQEHRVFDLSKPSNNNSCFLTPGFFKINSDGYSHLELVFSLS